MENLPDDLIVLLFRTPECVFVCRRFKTVLLRAHAIGLQDYYTVTMSRNCAPKVGKLEWPVCTGKSDTVMYITYGPPLIGASGTFGLTPHDIHPKDVGVYNVVAMVTYNGVFTGVTRLMPKQKNFVNFTIFSATDSSLSIRAAILESPRLLYNSEYTIYGRTVRERRGTSDKFVQWNSSTWPLALWCISLSHMNSVITRKMYHTHFSKLPAGLTEKRCGDVITG